MPCLLTLLALMVPRFVIVVLWFLTTWFEGVFASLLWPVLGFVFLPTTLLWYSAVHNWYGGQWGTWQVVVLVLAVLTDLSPAKGRSKKD
jgi:hypothetical protein